MRATSRIFNEIILLKFVMCFVINSQYYLKVILAVYLLLYFRRMSQMTSWINVSRSRQLQHNKVTNASVFWTWRCMLWYACTNMSRKRSVFSSG